MQIDPVEIRVLFTAFSDKMPVPGRPVFVVFTDAHDEAAADMMWFHTSEGYISHRGFGHIFFKSDGNQVSDWDHERMLKSGWWAYIADFAHQFRPVYGHPLDVHGEIDSISQIA